MKSFLFKPRLRKQILLGNKTVTRRLKDGYQVGDIVYLKEPYIKDHNGFIGFEDEVGFDLQHQQDFGWKKISPLFLPAAKARHFVKITEKSSEKLHDITEEDCIREGIESVICYGEKRWFIYSKYFVNLPWDKIPVASTTDDPLKSFYSLWVAINGRRSWWDNPTVYRYQFELLPDFKYQDQ